MTTRRTFLSWLGTTMVAMSVALPVGFGEEEPDTALPSRFLGTEQKIFYLEPDESPLKLLMWKLQEEERARARSKDDAED